MASRVHPSAGTYTSETDLSQRATAAGTSIGVIVGEASRGRVGIPVMTTDQESLRSEFGIPNAQKYGFGLYCASAFLGQSKQLWYYRVVSPDALTAGAYLTIDDLTAAAPIVKLTNFDDGANVPLGVHDPLNNLGFVNGTPGLENTPLYFCAVDPGEWNNTIAIRVRPCNPSGIDVEDERHYNPYQFYVDVFVNYVNANSQPVESFLVSRKYELNGDGQQMYVEDVINNFSNYIRVKNNIFCAPVKIKRTAFEFLDGGADGSRPTDAMIRAAWDAFADPEIIDVNLLINSGYTEPTIQRRMLEIAERRGDATAILDVPDSQYEAARAVNYRRNTLNVNTSYGALYTPFVQIRDTYNSKTLFIPPSGHVAAAYAFTDTNRAVWFAPAGLTRGALKVLGLRTKYNQGARDALDKANINPIRNIPGRGYTIMGQETLQAFASAFSNVNVRRLINYVKKSIANATLTGVYDPNDDFLRLSMIQICDDFMGPIRSGRGLYDYEAVCDERNNKPATIAAGDLYLDLFADPVIPAKRIHLTAHVQPTGTYFNEQ